MSRALKETSPLSSIYFFPDPLPQILDDYIRQKKAFLATAEKGRGPRRHLPRELRRQLQRIYGIYPPYRLEIDRYLRARIN